MWELNVNNDSLAVSLNDYSGDKCPFNERVSYFMDHCPISTNHSAIEAA